MAPAYWIILSATMIYLIGFMYCVRSFRRADRRWYFSPPSETIPIGLSWPFWAPMAGLHQLRNRSARRKALAKKEHARKALQAFSEGDIDLTFYHLAKAKDCSEKAVRQGYELASLATGLSTANLLRKTLPPSYTLL